MIDLLLVTCFALVFGAGCGALDNCPDGQKEPIDITTGKTDVDALFYESAAWNEFDHFPAKTKLRFEHHLGVTPKLVKAYLAFNEHGTNNAEAGSFAETAGNQSLYNCVDSNVIILRNDTCEEHFYVKLVAEGASEWDLGDECSDGSD